MSTTTSGACATEHRQCRSTGKERDSESGNDYFPARYYASSTGRWLSPDFIGGKLTNPQTLNRYAYVGNNPLRYIDPLGLAHCEAGSGSTQDACNSAGGMWALDPGDPGYGGSGGTTPNGGTASLSFGGNNGGSSSPTGGGSDGGSSGGGGGGGDVPIDNPWGQAAFGPQSLGTWTAANNTVKAGAAITVGAYGAAFALPAAASGAGYVANATGLLGPAANRVFWSAIGWATAANWADENGGTTLEMTPLGKFANWAQGYLPQTQATGAAWRTLSSWFASGAQGPVTYLQGSYLGQTWLNTEMPILMQNGNPITTVPIP